MRRGADQRSPASRRRFGGAIRPVWPRARGRDAGSGCRTVIGYTRRSRERANGFGLEAQADAIRRWADYEGVEVVEIVRDDDVQGVVEPVAREGLARALTLLEAHGADALVVAKFDRLARSIVGFADVLKLSQAQGWQLVCLDPMLDLRRAHDRAIAAMLISFADIEREAFIDRMQGGRTPRRPDLLASLEGARISLLLSAMVQPKGVLDDIERVLDERERGG